VQQSNRELSGLAVLQTQSSPHYAGNNRPDRREPIRPKPFRSTSPWAKRLGSLDQGENRTRRRDRSSCCCEIDWPRSPAALDRSHHRTPWPWGYRERSRSTASRRRRTAVARAERSPRPYRLEKQTRRTATRNRASVRRRRVVLLLLRLRAASKPVEEDTQREPIPALRCPPLCRRRRSRHVRALGAVGVLDAVVLS